MLDGLFRTGNAVALLGWAMLVLAAFVPRLRARIWPLTGILLPGAFAVAYAALILVHWWGNAGGFGSIAAVRALFDAPGLLVAGWFHYLAFDLFVGTWIAREAERTGVPLALLLPVFALTFLFGPAGFLLFLACRALAPAGAAPAHDGAQA